MIKLHSDREQTLYTLSRYCTPSRCIVIVTLRVLRTPSSCCSSSLYIAYCIPSPPCSSYCAPSPYASHSLYRVRRGGTPKSFLLQTAPKFSFKNSSHSVISVICGTFRQVDKMTYLETSHIFSISSTWRIFMCVQQPNSK